MHKKMENTKLSDFTPLDEKFQKYAPFIFSAGECDQRGCPIYRNRAGKEHRYNVTHAIIVLERLIFHDRHRQGKLISAGVKRISLMTGISTAGVKRAFELLLLNDIILRHRRMSTSSTTFIQWDILQKRLAEAQAEFEHLYKRDAKPKHISPIRQTAHLDSSDRSVSLNQEEPVEPSIAPMDDVSRDNGGTNQISQTHRKDHDEPPIVSQSASNYSEPNDSKANYNNKGCEASTEEEATPFKSQRLLTEDMTVDELEIARFTQRYGKRPEPCKLGGDLGW